MNPLSVLKRDFGHEAFRPYQEDIVRRVLEGRDVLAMLPTGAGKSLCYQLPAMILNRPTLVISPLIALMKDQVDGLPPAVHPLATLINSSVEADELEQRMQGIHQGRYKLIFAAPERLRQQRFLDLIRRSGLGLIVVDEAHCVSVWGHDFRPDYLFIRKALDSLTEGSSKLPGAVDGTPDASAVRPCLLALTATATPEMQLEISAQLGRPLDTVTAPTFRPNLKMEVLRCAGIDQKMRRLVEVCRETPGATIVYAGSRDRCEALASFLRRQGLYAAHYHAGLEKDERQKVQDRFMLGRTPIIVATVAFGMGVDKSNVRLVVHFNLPGSLEAYTQEAGRAGRDGRPARCVLLYAPSDKATLSRWTRQEEMKLETVRDVYRALQARLGKGAGAVQPEELARAAFPDGASQRDTDTKLRVAISVLERTGLLTRAPDSGRSLYITMLPAHPGSREQIETLLEARRVHAENRLAEIGRYVEGPICRHVAIALHFGQQQDACGAVCDCCLGTAESAGESGAPERVAPPPAAEVPDLGRVIMEAVRDMPFPVGRTGLARALAGVETSPIGKDRFPAHGKLAGFTLHQLRAFMDQLIDRGLLSKGVEERRKAVGMTIKGTAALSSSEMILANPTRGSGRPAAPSRPRVEGAPVADELDAGEADRFEQLRAWRKIEAQKGNVPPYVVFHDSTLRAIAQANPQTAEELSAIPGVGPNRLASYAESLLQLLNP